MIPEFITMMTQHLPVQPEQCHVTIVPVRNSQPKQCFKNASLYVKVHDGVYCLGYYLYEGHIPIEHAWVKTDAGHLEITLDDHHSDDDYYVVFQFDKKQLATIEKKYGFPPTMYEASKYLRETQ